MRYQGWNFEQTLLIASDLPGDRPRELVDVRISIPSSRAGNIQNDVRVVAKPDWNVLGAELPSQVYDIQTVGDITSFRVVFLSDIQDRKELRFGVLYGNAQAESPGYQSDLSITRKDGALQVDSHYFHMETDKQSGQISHISLKTYRRSSAYFHCITPENHVQPGAAICFSRAEGHLTRSAADWESPNYSVVVEGPLFCCFERTDNLRADTDDGHVILRTSYAFFPDEPIIVVNSELRFEADTEVFGIDLGILAIDSSQFTHYTFRPVSENLPPTDVEEMGHILIDPSFTEGLPDGNIFSGFLPYDLAWQSFINIKKAPQGKQYAFTDINLGLHSQSPAGPAPSYRQAAYLHRSGVTTQFSRAPVYVKRKDKRENLQVIPAGTVFSTADALYFSPIVNERWDTAIENKARRLNSPLKIRQFPEDHSGLTFEEGSRLLPAGRRAAAYMQRGLR